jgi:uncharacterized RDD family membrane protein YckC
MIPFNIMIKELYFFIFIVCLHELGHYIAFESYGYTPKMKIRWWGISIGDDITYLLSSFQLIVVLLSGIGLGFIGILFHIPNITYTNESIIQIYFILCSMDIITLINVLNIPKKYLKLPLYISQYNQSKDIYYKYITLRETKINGRR